MCVYKDSTMKPTKHFEKEARREEKNGNIMKGGTCSKYTMHVYRIIKMKPPFIIKV
jgi:hypothetical protein